MKHGLNKHTQQLAHYKQLYLTLVQAIVFNAYLFYISVFPCAFVNFHRPENEYNICKNELNKTHQQHTTTQ
jgi:hypothetical protein